jgi:hypothetical protein
MGLSRAANTDGVFVSMRALLSVGTHAQGHGSDHELHVDRDVICPRCMQWIEPTDFVRQTRYGLLQHEACA